MKALPASKDRVKKFDVVASLTRILAALVVVFATTSPLMTSFLGRQQQDRISRLSSQVSAEAGLLDSMKSVLSSTASSLNDNDHRSEPIGPMVDSAAAFGGFGLAAHVRGTGDDARRSLSESISSLLTEGALHELTTSRFIRGHVSVAGDGGFWIGLTDATDLGDGFDVRSRSWFNQIRGSSGVYLQPSNAYHDYSSNELVITYGLSQRLTGGRVLVVAVDFRAPHMTEEALLSILNIVVGLLGALFLLLISRRNRGSAFRSLAGSFAIIAGAHIALLLLSNGRGPSASVEQFRSIYFFVPAGALMLVASRRLRDRRPHRYSRELRDAWILQGVFAVISLRLGPIPSQIVSASIIGHLAYNFRAYCFRSIPPGSGEAGAHVARWGSRFAVAGLCLWAAAQMGTLAIGRPSPFVQDLHGKIAGIADWADFFVSPTGAMQFLLVGKSVGIGGILVALLAIESIRRQRSQESSTYLFRVERGDLVTPVGTTAMSAATQGGPIPLQELFESGRDARHLVHRVLTRSTFEDVPFILSLVGQRRARFLASGSWGQSQDAREPTYFLRLVQQSDDFMVQSICKYLVRQSSRSSGAGRIGGAGRQSRTGERIRAYREGRALEWIALNRETDVQRARPDSFTHRARRLMIRVLPENVSVGEFADEKRQPLGAGHEGRVRERLNLRVPDANLLFGLLAAYFEEQTEPGKDYVLSCKTSRVVNSSERSFVKPARSSNQKLELHFELNEVVSQLTGRDDERRLDDSTVSSAPSLNYETSEMIGEFCRLNSCDFDQPRSRGHAIIRVPVDLV